MKNKNVKREDNYLLYVPIIKHEKWEVKNNRVYLIFYHGKLIERFVRWLVKKPNISDIELDEVGSKIWQYIDGVSTVYEIGQKVLKEYGEKFDPEYKRLIMFLNYMNKKGWISFGKGMQE